MLNINQFNYHLPQELIAQKPLDKRDSSKLLVVNRQDQSILDTHFSDLAKVINSNYLLVRNNTKVIPARIFGHKTTGGHVELLLTKRVNLDKNNENWECLTKPGIKKGQHIRFENSKLSATCIKEQGYTRLINFDQANEELFETLYKIGHTPIPPYINWKDEDEKHLREIYQTTFAKYQGSAAAPTAGLHFTPELDQKLQNAGVEIVEVTLHVGLGTFLPVKDDNILDHKMHSEKYILTKEASQKINQARQNGKKIIAIGTTTTRVLESCADKDGILQPSTGETDIYIYPGYQFKIVDGLITNFHLPKSTLLMLVSALASNPQTDEKFTNFENSLIGTAYQHAIENNYRFYSFGDGMIIL